MGPVRPLRPLAAVVATGALCLFATAGCGTVDAPVGAFDKPPVSASVQAADYARSVNLRASDVPYLEPQADDRDGPSRRERRSEREFERCLGLEGQGEDKPLAEDESPEFAATTPGAYLSIQSSVEVQRDMRGAAKAVRILRGRRVADCMRRVYVPVIEGLGSGNTEVSRVSIRRLRPPLPGVDLSFGFRLSAITTVHPDLSQSVAYRPSADPLESHAVPIHIDLLDFLVGTAQITLTVNAAPTPASRALERNLLTKMHERALANRP